MVTRKILTTTVINLISKKVPHLVHKMNNLTTPVINLNLKIRVALSS